MLLKSKENQAILQILEILNKKETTYGKLFKETKVSHTTLQKVLKYLTEKQFVAKDDNYKITHTGTNLLQKLQELKKILL